jgi:hypothetical protein
MPTAGQTISADTAMRGRSNGSTFERRCGVVVGMSRSSDSLALITDLRAALAEDASLGDLERWSDLVLSIEEVLQRDPSVTIVETDNMARVRSNVSDAIAAIAAGDVAQLGLVTMPLAALEQSLRRRAPREDSSLRD